jgi:ADP-heptose:LPS heptosyltransferase
VLLVGGEAEVDRQKRLAQVLQPGRSESLHNSPLPELAGRLAECAAFLGHDSGISHLAAAVGLPGVVLWGDSTECIWRPPSPQVTVVRDPAGLNGLTVDRVLAALRQIN